MSPLQITEFFAGFGLFLFAIALIEKALQQLAGRGFKVMLARRTQGRFSAFWVGCLATAILQSSSAVTLMLLAFVSSGVLQFSNALGVVLGANLGTTMTGWIVSLLGFEFDIEDFVFPILAVGSLAYVFFKKYTVLHRWGQFLTGFALLFLGLDFMKGSAAELQNHFDLVAYAHSPYLVFAALGAVLTAVIQSSSAAMVITLTSLHSGFLSLTGAAAFVVGADLGTTVTAALGAAGTSVDKKRVAAFHVLFNVMTAVMTLSLLPYFLRISTWVMGVDNPLFTLVFFHSLFNLTGALLCGPFLGKISDFLHSRIRAPYRTSRLLDVPAQQVDPALSALESEAQSFVLRVLDLNYLGIVGKARTTSLGNGGRNFSGFEIQYSHLKEVEAEMMAYSYQIQTQQLSSAQSQELERTLAGVRNAALSAKAVKDVLHNIREAHTALEDSVYRIYEVLVEETNRFYLEVEDFLVSPDLDHIQNAEDLIDGFYTRSYQLLEGMKGQRGVSYLPHLLNLLGECFQSEKLILQALKDVYLNLPPTKGK